jgi:DNA polymerase III delta prime subunit
MTTASSRVLETARRGELHHAIILYGPSLPLLRDLGMRIAKALNCINDTTGDDCAACQRIDRRIHPDVHFAEVAGDKKLIAVEQIREIVENATMRPYEAKKKVFIIDPADALSVSGSNSLLKTLEEPPRDTHFILITRTPDLLLPTIKSRTQHIHVAGAVRDLSHAEQVSMIEGSGDELATDIIDTLHRYATKNESAALLALAAIVSGRDDVKDSIALLGGILCEAVASPEGKLAEVAAKIPRERLLAAADIAMNGIRWLGVNADARLLVEQVVAALV